MNQFLRDFEKETGMKLYRFSPYTMCGTTQATCKYIMEIDPEGKELHCTKYGHLVAPDGSTQGKIKIRSKKYEAMYILKGGYYEQNSEFIETLPIK